MTRLIGSWLNLGTGHYSCRVGEGGGGRREKRRGGGQGYFRLAIGEGAKHFYKEVLGGQQIDREVYF